MVCVPVQRVEPGNEAIHMLHVYTVNVHVSLYMHMIGNSV